MLQFSFITYPYRELLGSTYLFSREKGNAAKEKLLCRRAGEAMETRIY